MGPLIIFSFIIIGLLVYIYYDIEQFKKNQ
jgi:hypothetical protein